MKALPRISLPAHELIDLIESYDAWAGAMPPEERDRYRERFAAVKRRARMALAKYGSGK